MPFLPRMKSNKDANISRYTRYLLHPQQATFGLALSWSSWLHNLAKSLYVNFLKEILMKNIKLLLVLGSLFAAVGAAQSGASTAPESAPAISKNDQFLTNGEVRKVDMEYKKITIKHGDIKEFDMPGMTMVFGVKDAVLLDKIKAGDKVTFRTEKAGGALVVTEIQLAK